MDKAEWDETIEVLKRPERRRGTLEGRIALLEDHEEIRDLIMRYGILADALRSPDREQRLDDLFDLYTDDVVREVKGTLDQRASGKAELREMMTAPTLRWKDETGEASLEQRVAAYRLMQRQASRHLITAEVIRVGDNGSEASAVAQYTLVKTSDEDGEHFRGVHEGGYIFDFRKVDSVWKIARFVVIANHAHNPMFKTMLDRATTRS